MADEWGVGNQVDAEPWGTAKVGSTPVALIWGQHPHSRSDNKIYARFPSGKVEAFDGHRLPARVEIEESNYLKTSEMSGDEVRKGGECRIFLNGVQVYGFFTRDAQRALIKAHALLDELRGHTATAALIDERVPEGDRLRGRKVYYRGTPAILGYTMPSQGCVMVEPAPGLTFPPDVHTLDSDGDDYYDGERDRKISILSDDIWWHRKKLVDGEPVESHTT